ncbi:Glu-tRNA(Gln) amidotransferase subunit GatE [Candidatus Woesearchaeota archaeon]|nr:Glu-tRNA(Gln) amidotransferase subunit GatE [Candidatus Woesearchaeota archaeon]
MNYQKLGFKCGVECHQQLEGKKLFCSCPAIIKDDKPDFIVRRKLRASAGEKGAVDIAAKYEQKIGKEFIYNIYKDCTCLVELDDEPPHEVNKDALKIALQISMLLNARINDKIQFMRKVVIDGSNTSAFQRTALIAMDGYIETSKGRVNIPTICLEEEAAKIVEKTDVQVVYNLSRLGIPLLEIATDASIKDPEHAKEVSEKIGMILRSVDGIKRGLGTIRQDVNVSIENGTRVELKGFQELKSIPKVIQGEIDRQLKLIQKGEKLKSEVRNAKPDGTSEFLRPMPGAERMYPETDIPTIDITPEMMSKILEREINFDKFLIKGLDNNFVAKVLIDIPKEIKSRLNLDSSKLKDSDFLLVLNEISKGAPRQAAIDMLADIIKDGKLNVKKYKGVSDKELESDIKGIIAKNKGASINALVGEIMKKYHGKVEGKKVVDLIKKLS